jgi:hypothetical protein
MGKGAKYNFVFCKEIVRFAVIFLSFFFFFPNTFLCWKERKKKERKKTGGGKNKIVKRN